MGGGIEMCVYTIKLMKLHLLAPDSPKTDVFDPTLTTSPSSPVMVPETITIFASSPSTAAVSSSSVVTVVVEPPEPPEVLNTITAKNSKGSIRSDYFKLVETSMKVFIAYPPFWAAYPIEATSSADARVFNLGAA